MPTQDRRLLTRYIESLERQLKILEDSAARITVDSTTADAIAAEIHQMNQSLPEVVQPLNLQDHLSHRSDTGEYYQIASLRVFLSSALAALTAEQVTEETPASIEENATGILERLAAESRPPGGRAEVTASDISQATGLNPNDTNDAVAILVEGDLAEWLQAMGTVPYSFSSAWITPRGRYELERMQAATEIVSDIPTPLRPPIPVGSPYGFRDEDWEILAERKANTRVLHVVLGYQFESTHYDAKQLTENVERMFQEAVREYNGHLDADRCELSFSPLAAGYGEHLFNEIARDTISSDIAVFETSDLNPNVMLEMGVALTWDVRVLPIKQAGCPKPPSDISGQTWADYDDSGAVFSDPDHERKLMRMVERAVRKKGRA